MPNYFGYLTITITHESLHAPTPHLYFDEYVFIIFFSYGYLFLLFFTIYVFDICDLLPFIICSYVNSIVYDKYLNLLPIPYIIVNM